MPKRIVVKIGSNVLSRVNGTLDVTRISALVDQIAELHRAGHEIVIVSSGAVASGRSFLNVQGELNSVEQRQLFSAVGQARLINRYFELFHDQNIFVGQVLTTKDNFRTPELFRNQQHCMEVMINNKVIPIVNENDTVSLTELMFTDNDELSGLIADMMHANLLIILSNVDGVYDGDIASPTSRVIPIVKPDDDLTDYVRNEKSAFGRGGMLTKSSVARQVAAGGIEVVIANGKREDVLLHVVDGNRALPYTLFLPQEV